MMKIQQREDGINKLVSSWKNAEKINTTLFTEFFPSWKCVKELFPYQRDALSKCVAHVFDSKERPMRVVMPTGTGKTLVQISIIDGIITGGPKCKVSLVVAPTISLLDQHRKSFVNDSAYSKVTGHVMFYSSRIEQREANHLKMKEKSTTNIGELTVEVDRLLNNGCEHVVVFSSYASLHRLTNFEFVCGIFDESQYCLETEIFKIIPSFNMKKQFFFTATEKHFNEDKKKKITKKKKVVCIEKWHNNEGVFGKLGYEYPVKIALADSRIVPPYYAMLAGNTDKKKHNSLIDIIIKATNINISFFKDSTKHTKIIFCLDGTQAVKHASDAYKTLRKEFPEHSIFAITSHRMMPPTINGEKVDKSYFFEELHKCKNALIFQYEMLIEGFNDPEINGVYIDRNMSQTTLQQAVGRAVRNHTYEIDGVLKKKEKALITFGGFNGDMDAIRSGAKFLRAMKTGDYPVSFEYIYDYESSPIGIVDNDGVSSRVFTPAQRIIDGVLEELLVYIEGEDSEETKKEVTVIIECNGGLKDMGEKLAKTINDQFRKHEMEKMLKC